MVQCIIWGSLCIFNTSWPYLSQVVVNMSVGVDLCADSDLHTNLLHNNFGPNFKEQTWRRRLSNSQSINHYTQSHMIWYSDSKNVTAVVLFRSTIKSSITKKIQYIVPFENFAFKSLRLILLRVIDFHVEFIFISKNTVNILSLLLQSAQRVPNISGNMHIYFLAERYIKRLIILTHLSAYYEATAS